MTDKEQIIIDGVIVSDCKHFCLEPQIPEMPIAGISKICCEENIAKECMENPNCYFKQLARKTQECEELKEKYEEVKEDRYNLNMEMYTLHRYRKALTEIKELANCGKDMYIERGKYPDYEAMAEWMKNQFVFILDIINKAKGEGNGN